jgi:hypothetical protein
LVWSGDHRAIIIKCRDMPICHCAGMLATRLDSATASDFHAAIALRNDSGELPAYRRSQ